jgi:hypothetical protein
MSFYIYQIVERLILSNTLQLAYNYKLLAISYPLFFQTELTFLDLSTVPGSNSFAIAVVGTNRDSLIKSSTNHH